MLRSSRFSKSIYSYFNRLPIPMGLRRRLLFLYFNRRMPRFAHPVTFSDKVNWRIVNDRRELLEWTCDKLSMKEYVIKAALDGLRIPETIWFGSDVRELQEIELPEHWVLKPNHRSGLVHFGHGRPETEELLALTANWLDTFESKYKGEWAYAKARPALVLEELLGTPGCPPPDYKFFVFDGKAAAIQVDVDRHSAHRRRLYRRDWQPLEVRYGSYDLAPVIPKIASLERMLTIAERLGQLFDFIRVDLYDIEGVIGFGELTPYPGGGLERFVPATFDAELGGNWALPRL
jgi:TupA-like ATPgrasp